MIKSEIFNEAVLQNQNLALKLETDFFRQYCRYLKNNRAALSRFSRLQKTLLREDRIIMKAEIIPTLSDDDKWEYYHMLEVKQMRMKEEILDCISEIATAEDPIKEIKKWSKFPWFSIDIKENNQYTVTFQNESYTFHPIRSCFPNEISKIIQYHFYDRCGMSEKEEFLNPALAPGRLDYACHFSSEYFSNFFPDTFAVTSLCPHIVKNGLWYHSFNLSHDQITVYDVSNGFIMDYETFQKLLEPIILDQILGEDIPFRKQELINSGNDFYSLYGDACPLKGFAFQNFDSFSEEKQNQIFNRVKKLKKMDGLD